MRRCGDAAKDTRRFFADLARFVPLCRPEAFFDTPDRSPPLTEGVSRGDELIFLSFSLSLFLSLSNIALFTKINN